MLLHLPQKRACCETEHACVPEVTARFEVFAGFVLTGLFDKSDDVLAFGFDVAVAGLGGGWLYAEGDQLSLLGQFSRLVDGLLEALVVGDEVIGCQHQHDFILAMQAFDFEGGCSNGGGRVATEGLENVGKACALGCDLQVLFLCLEKQVAVGDGHHGLNRIQLNPTQQRFLYEALPITQADERFGVLLSRNGPQT